jgi:hypothetical protein
MVNLQPKLPEEYCPDFLKGTFYHFGKAQSYYLITSLFVAIWVKMQRGVAIYRQKMG